MTPHPQHCETCTKHECSDLNDGIDTCEGVLLQNYEWEAYKKRGCASHSSKAPAPAAPDAATIRNQTLDDVAKLILKEAGIEKQRPFNPDTDRIPEIGIDVIGGIINSLRTPSTQEHERK